MKHLVVWATGLMLAQSMPSIAQTLLRYEIIPLRAFRSNNPGTDAVDYSAIKVDRTTSKIHRCAVQVQYYANDKMIGRCSVATVADLPRNLGNVSVTGANPYQADSLPPLPHASLWLVDQGTGDVSLCEFFLYPVGPRCYKVPNK